MPLFRAVGTLMMERGIDAHTVTVLLALTPALPFIFGIGALYELYRSLDHRQVLSERTHWALATASTLLIVAVAALFLMGGAPGPG